MKSFLKKSALRGASCLQALSITGLTVSAIAMSAPAAAQDYTAGAVSGTVTDATGAAVSGATVTLTSNDTGGSRTTTSTATGAFRFSSLTPGNYTLKVTSPGAPDFTATDVRVVASQTAALNVALATGGGQEIVVTAAQIQQPFTGTTTGVAVDLEDLVTKVPIGRDITNVMLLAPGTTKAGPARSAAHGRAASTTSSSTTKASRSRSLTGANRNDVTQLLPLGHNVPAQRRPCPVAPDSVLRVRSAPGGRPNAARTRRPRRRIQLPRRDGAAVATRSMTGLRIAVRR